MRAFVSLIVGLAAVAGCKQQTKQPSYADSVAFYANQPRFMQPVPYSAVPEGLPDLNAATCGKCHVEIYEEWRISTHARAWRDDAQFMAELDKSNKQGVGWMCINCHTPMVNQLERVVVGLEGGAVEKPITIANPHFDADLQNDAITCGTCHVREGVIYGPYGDTIAPHPVAKDERLLTPEVCTQCHQAKAEFKQIALACVFDTGMEYAASPYPGEGKICQSCHMPEVVRPTATNGRPRKTRRHWFGGSLIPKKPEFAAELAAISKHYPPGLTIAWVEPKATARANDRVVLRYEYQNANAGHLLPSGDPERFLRIETVAMASGKVLAESSEHIGSVYQWAPEVKKLSDNRLAPREVRTGTVAFTMPSAGPVFVRLTASRFRINEENLKYHGLEGQYVAGQEILTTTATVTISR